MTVTGYAPDDLTPARPDGSGTPIPARRTAFDDLADQAARLPWCWPALVTLAFGFYQVGRPELWRDELASGSFASRPVTEMISAARHTGATQLAYYLRVHVWIVAFEDSADAMRALSVLAMAAAAACVALVGRRLAGARPAGRRASVRADPQRVQVRPGGPVLRGGDGGRGAGRDAGHAAAAARR